MLLCGCGSQEDKEAMFDCFDTIHGALQVTTGVMSTLKVSLVLLLLFVLLLLNYWRKMNKQPLQGTDAV